MRPQAARGLMCHYNLPEASLFDFKHCLGRATSVAGASGIELRFRKCEWKLQMYEQSGAATDFSDRPPVLTGCHRQRSP
jgi:hypothetical protein